MGAKKEKREKQEESEFGHWEVCCQPVENPFGFIYLITNTVSNRKYIGKKQVKTVRKLKPLKGKRNKRHVDAETDWKTYTGSSNELNEDIKKLGKDKFLFQILKYCPSKSALAYWETKIQFENDVLLKEEYYNGIINCRIGKIKM